MTATIERQRTAGRSYSERWKSFIDKGHKPVILTRSQHPEYWTGWLSWFQANDCVVQVELMRDGRREMTVPCLDPRDFADG